MQPESYRLIVGRVASVLLRGCLAATLLSATTGTSTATAHNTIHKHPLSLFPVADGTVSDSNRDGRGDSILDGYASVVVGFNALGPGQHRGVYEFVIRSWPKLRAHDRVVLWLNRTGTRMNGTDDRLTLWVGAGDGVLTNSDYAAGRFGASFVSLDIGPALGWYDNRIDVTKSVRHLLQRGARFVLFVIRPNPLFASDQGAILFSTLETSQPADPQDQFLPAMLVLERGR